MDKIQKKRFALKPGFVAELTVSYKYKSEFNQVITKSSDVDQFIKNFIMDQEIDQQQERLHLILINKANKVLGYQLLSIGGLAGTIADPMIIGQLMVHYQACNIILVHNHPSGNLQFSEADIRMSKQIYDVAKMLSCHLMDSIVYSCQWNPDGVPDYKSISMANTGHI